MVVLATPTPPTDYVRLALFVNGAAMIHWAPQVYAGKKIICWAEGPRAVEKKTPFDRMIWRICGMWVGFIGAMCMQVSYIMNFEKAPIIIRLANSFVFQCPGPPRHRRDTYSPQARTANRDHPLNRDAFEIPSC